MPEEKGKFERTKKLREALKKGPSKDPKARFASLVPPQVAAAATPKKPKNNHRTAKARDIRAKMKGRMPVNLRVFAEWDGEKWCGTLYAMTKPPGVEGAGGDLVNDLEYEAATMPKQVKTFRHQADGLFRLMEEMDCMFWEWFAKEATADQKARLTFVPDPPEPAPWPNPPASEGTAPAPH